MNNSVVNLNEKLSLLDEQWSPRIIAQLNDYFFKIVEVHGDFVWHSHSHTDEAFIVLDGEMEIEMRDRSVQLKAMDMFVVPRGVEHKPNAAKPCKLMLVEPGGTDNTGDADSDRTVPEDRWI